MTVRLMLEEVVMSDGQMYSFLQFFLTLRKLTKIEDWITLSQIMCRLHSL